MKTRRGLTVGVSPKESKGLWVGLSQELWGCRGYLEAGGDGGVLVVSGLCVANEVIPACEHLPAEGELPFLSITTAYISIFGHSE